MPDQPTALDIALQARDQWQSLFYYAVGGLASGCVGLAFYIKGITSELATAKMEAAKGDLAQAKSNDAVAAALVKMADALETATHDD